MQETLHITYSFLFRRGRELLSHPLSAAPPNPQGYQTSARL